MPFGPTHTAIRQLASWACDSFYSEVLTVNASNVPKDGPVIVASNHHNMTVDPAVLSVTFPHGRKLHYWAKNTLFKNPIANYILTDAGNIPVDRTTKNNQLLFKGTFDVLKLGECVAIFPEGTSYTEPRIVSIKDGIGWTALEYAKNLRETGGRLSGEPSTANGDRVAPNARDVTIAICGLNYVSKSKYRSRILVLYAPSISVEPYIDEFLTPGGEKSAVKKLVKEVEARMRSVTVNGAEGEGWEGVWCGNLVRQILWPKEDKMPLSAHKDVMQTLVDLFSNASCTADPRLANLRTLLISYYGALHRASLRHPDLATVPLPASLDPDVPHPLPGRLRAFWVLLKDTARIVIRAPWFLAPVAVHLPLYFVGYLGGKLQDDEESAAQNKIVLALLICLVLYPVMFFLALPVFSSLLVSALPLPNVLLLSSAMAAATFTYWFAAYHVSLLDDTYLRLKRLVASYRVLIGIWFPRAGRAVGVEEAEAGARAAAAANGTAAPKAERARENTVRRVLRLRMEAVAAVGRYFAEVATEGKSGREVVEMLRSKGAKLPVA